VRERWSLGAGIDRLEAYLHAAAAPPARGD
jgi:hypothetical protein